MAYMGSRFRKIKELIPWKAGVLKDLKEVLLIGI
jgi:hypothetical protein